MQAPKSIKEKGTNGGPPGKKGKKLGAHTKPKSDALLIKSCPVSASASMGLLLSLDEKELRLVSELFAEHRFIFSQFAFAKFPQKEERAEIIISMLGEIPLDLKLLHEENGAKGKYKPSHEACEASFILFAELVARNPLSAVELKREMDKSPPNSQEGKAIHAMLESICTENGTSSLEMLGLPPSASFDFTLHIGAQL